MICQCCRKRKAQHEVYDDGLKMTLQVCTKCKTSLYDEPDFGAIERQAEKQAHLDAEYGR